ncbi:uncharacterized protein LOC143896401 isoform X1 [Temnothorax americanus]|uniref:uncharacterized protein LOC143896401 isoform X1 n=1 Tax=Temnothorax americanus TaxID=1964332 RepID=UPI00406831CE
MSIKFCVLFLLISITANARSHRHHHHHHHHEYYPEHRKENSHVNFVEQKSNFGNEETTDTVQSESSKKNVEYSEVLDSKGSIPFSARRLEKMLEKAILKIITGDLGTAEMLLLKSLNYTPEEVLAIRERELDNRKDEELRKIEESNEKKYNNENLYRDKAKHWNYNSMELESSSRNDPDVDVARNERKKNRYKGKASYDKDFDFDAYNRQAVIDYENLASKLELQQSWSEPANFDYETESRNSEEQNPSQNIHQDFDRAMEPHVIFKIPYDDSKFDSSFGSNEKSKFIDRDALVLSKDLKHRIPLSLRHTTARNVANSFHASSLSTTSSSSSSSASSATTGHTPLPIVYQLRNFEDVRSDHPKNQPSFSTTEFPEPITTSAIITNVTSNATFNITDFADSANDDKLSVKDADNTTNRKISEYEGLEWVGDDVYRVIPAFADSLGYDNTDETSDDEEQNLDIFPEGNENDTVEYQNDALDPTKLFTANANGSIENASQTNLTLYQQLARAHRLGENVTSSFASLSQKVIDNIKIQILMVTGRWNLSTDTNQVQREKLTMFPPACQIPRNADPEAWMDPFSMNMYFQLNFTARDYIVAARLRISKLPQENVTTSDFRLSNPFDEDEDEKIRISVYYYTKALRKHRSKKRLMDSIVTSLTGNDTPLALDVRHGLRAWRPSPRNQHGNNHGLVIEIEDQDGRPLKPAQYIQQPTCGDHDLDKKASERTPALFVRACPRYIRIVNDKKVMYINCSRH